LVVLVVDASSTFGLRLTYYLLVWVQLTLIPLVMSSDGLCDKASMITSLKELLEKISQKT
jgi:hypothetical protein